MYFNYQRWFEQVELTVKESGEISDDWKDWADWEQLCKDGFLGNEAAKKVIKERLREFQENVDGF